MSSVHEWQCSPIVPLFPSLQHSSDEQATHVLTPPFEIILVFFMHEKQLVWSFVHLVQLNAVGV